MDAPSAEAAYMFAHALLQRACYELMLPSERAELHRRALEYLHTHKLGAPEELAVHALAGQAGAPPAIAAQLKTLRRGFLHEAAESALNSYANERGFSLLNELFMCEGLSDVERIQILRRRAETLNRIGHMDAAVDEAQAALRAAQELGEQLEIARAQLVLGRCCLDSSSNARAPMLLASAVESLRRLDDARALELAVSAMSRALFTAGRTEEALVPAQEAVTLAQTLRDEPRVIRGRMHLMTILAQLGRNDEATALSATLAPLLDSSPSPEIRCALASALASLSHGLGQLEEARGYHERASQEATAGGMHAEVARAEVNLGGVALQLRRFSDGLMHVERAEAMARELGNMRVLWFALRNRYETYDAVGDFRNALQAATSAARVAEAASMAWHYLVSCAQAAAAFLELGQAEDALEWVEGALAAPRAGQFLNFVLAKLHAQRACALQRVGRQSEATHSVKQMEQFLKLAGSEPDMDSQRWIQEARSYAAL